MYRIRNIADVVADKLHHSPMQDLSADVRDMRRSSRAQIDYIVVSREQHTPRAAVRIIGVVLLCC